MTIHDLLPVVSRLSHAEKFRLVQVMIQQLADEEGIAAVPSASEGQSFDPKNFYGRGRSSRETIDAYLAAFRSGWTQ
ncbi:hypothetical protein [Acidithiobacillus ferriphilus]|uniref:hypothetical protein n=1 Tax=Acidithiobacillus ferriphilus TaxID=1689834 RepID=UPI001C077070|nr:hypothetical protein [Acidithiobacillus ferriphilus]MBU2853525.1 hypothetical protein [Acidithiobacillus ferriphilus]